MIRALKYLLSKAAKKGNHQDQDISAIHALLFHDFISFS